MRLGYTRFSFGGLICWDGPLLFFVFGVSCFPFLLFWGFMFSLLFCWFCIFIKHDGLADRARTVAQQWTGGATARHHHVVECIIHMVLPRNYGVQGCVVCKSSTPLAPIPVRLRAWNVSFIRMYCTGAI